MSRKEILRLDVETIEDRPDKVHNEYSYLRGPADRAVFVPRINDLIRTVNCLVDALNDSNDQIDKLQKEVAKLKEANIGGILFK